MSNSKLRQIARQLPNLPLFQNGKMVKRKFVKSVYGHQILNQNKDAKDTNGKPINPKAMYKFNTEEIVLRNHFETLKAFKNNKEDINKYISFCFEFNKQPINQNLLL